MLRQLALQLIVAATTATLVQPDQLPLQTSSRWIVDAKGRRVKLACVNWSGAAQKDGVVGGLQHQPARRIAALFAAQGFNCVRIPWSVASVRQPHNVTNQTLLAANPSLMGRSNLDILDAVVEACAAAQLMVVLDNHMSDPDWCCSETDENGLWYNDRWPEAEWLAAHVALATRYEHQPYVVAAELRNELRSAVVGGQKRSPVWGGGSDTTDWRAAALRAATALLSARPSGLLIVVDGLSYSTDLTGAYDAPLTLPVANRLVYSAHDYSWSQYVGSEAALHALLGQRWGFLVAQGEPFTAPVWVSEWGDWHDGRDFGSGWWVWFEAYLRAADLDWAYWRGDGTESRGTGRTFGASAGFGVLNTSWDGPAAGGVLLRSLQPLQNATQGPGVDRPAVAVAASPSAAGVEAVEAAARR